ncbi:MAG: hypothetical protein ACIAQF_07790 [Phycisphaerales bacterium JB065]
MNRYSNCVVFVLVTLLFTSIAQAQVGLLNPLQGLDTSPPVTRSDIRILDSILGLGEDQRKLTNALFQDYFDSYQAAASETRLRIIEFIDDALATQDSALADEADTIAEEWPEQRSGFRDTFYADLKLLLDQQQIELWPKVEREIRRTKLLREGQLAGESVDLIRIIDANAPSWTSNPELIDMLDRYAQRLDAALRTRQREIDSGKRDEYKKTIRDNPFRAEEIFREILPTRLRVRDINTQTMRESLPLLPSDEAKAVEQAFYKAALEPRMPTSPIESRILAAASLPSLNNDQREAITRIIRTYEGQRDHIIEELFELVTELQAETLPHELSSSLMYARREAETGEKFIRGVSMDNPSEIKEVLHERRDLERATWNRVNALLTPEQRTELPILTQEILWFHNFLSHGI